MSAPLAVRVRPADAALAVDARILIHGDGMKCAGIATGAHVVARRDSRDLFAGTAWPVFDGVPASVSIPSLLARPVHLAPDEALVVAPLADAPRANTLCIELREALAPLEEALVRTVLMHLLRTSCCCAVN